MAKEPKTADSGFMTQDKTKVDLIYRQAAIEALEVKYMSFGIFREQRAASQCIDVIKHLPSAQPERRFDEWCTDCKEYDQEKHCCPRFNRVIRTTLQEVQPERKKGKWIHGKELSKSYIGDMCIGINYEDWRCSECNIAVETYDKPKWNFCPNCGAEMEGEDTE